MVKRVIWIIILAAILIYAIPKLLEQLSLLISGRNEDQIEETEETLLFPPILDDLPVATNSAEITVRGFAQNADRVEIFINDIKKDTTVIGTKDGSFVVDGINLYDGNNAVTAVAYGPRNTKSEPSDPMTVFFKQGSVKLVVESPEDGVKVQGGSNKFEVRGLTDPENTITINGRWTRVSTEGVFKSTFDLSEGENGFQIVARDRAGNENSIARTVTYSK